MAELSIGQIARRGFTGLFDPRGRDNRIQFWIFVTLVFAPLIAVQFVAQFAMMFGTIDFAATGASAGPEAGRRLFAQQLDAMVDMARINTVLYLIAAVLLTAAAARRLHDRGRSGWWALVLPFGFVATGLTQIHRVALMAERMPALVAEMEAKPGLEPTEMLKWMTQGNAVGNDVAWLSIVAGAILLWLIIELLRAGTDGPNRFGPPPG